VPDFLQYHNIDDVRAQSDAFISIAAFFLEWELDGLGFELKNSYRKNKNASLSGQDIDQADKFDAKLARLGLLELRNKAALFFLAIGSLKE